MKKVIFLILSIILTMTSCLESGLQELPAYEEADIKSFNFEYRWVNDNKMAVQKLDVATTFDNENAKIICDITVPAANGIFTESEREKVAITGLVGYCDLSTAATIEPTGNSPKLGAVKDWSNKNYCYNVKSASGVIKKWTIVINTFNK